ncbi:MAG: hypothetical protein KAS32_09315 [Candidatus Peribacteraceae bacterium]|nr:hypothetical protein [Candidatus Peribacteraceae bacterium]
METECNNDTKREQFVGEMIQAKSDLDYEEIYDKIITYKTTKDCEEHGILELELTIAQFMTIGVYIGFLLLTILSFSGDFIYTVLYSLLMWFTMDLMAYIGNMIDDKTGKYTTFRRAIAIIITIILSIFVIHKFQVGF